MFERFGPDKGGDIPLATEYTRNLRPLLNAYGNDPRFTLVLFTLDESTYCARAGAARRPLPRRCGSGPPWWFHDCIEGMTRFRQQVTETAGIYNTAGFNDDTRAFCRFRRGTTWRAASMPTSWPTSSRATSCVSTRQSV